MQTALDRQQFDSVPEYFRQVAGYAHEPARNGQPDRLRQLAHPHFGFTLAEARAEGAPPLLPAVSQIIEDRAQRRAEAAEQLAQQERARVAAQQQARTEKELALMARAFDIYCWKPAGKLQACLLVPDQHVREAAKLLSEWGHGCYGQALGVQGEPPRHDGKTPVYVLYDAASPAAAHVTNVMSWVAREGGEILLPASHQARREQVRHQVAPPTRGQEQPQPTKSRAAEQEM